MTLPNRHSESTAPGGKVLLTGATGYIGGRLLTQLEMAGFQVRCLTRDANRLRNRVGPQTEIVEADVLDREALDGVMDGVATAFYLVHSMGSTSDFEDQDRVAASNFITEASRAGVDRVIYLGGLGNRDSDLSKHLRSRQETGDVLRSTSVPVIEFRASIVIGSGSLSFEMIRALTERLPVMICPKWVQVAAQPIGIEDVLAYLIEAVKLPTAESQVFEIGGPDQVTYGEIMQEYARQRGLTRVMVPVPLLTPYLSSLWLGLVTPLYARVGRKMIDSMKNPTVVSNNLALQTFEVVPLGMPESIARAMLNEDQEVAATRWSDALSAAGNPKSWGGVRFGSRLVDSRSLHVAKPPKQAFEPITRIGGERGWYYGNWMWRIRGWLDLLVGGVGLRRGRKHPRELSPGDTLDFWRVEAYEPNRLLRLRAEMRLPGRAWLEFEVQPDAGGSTIRQTAIFDPIGVLGLAYWYAMYPAHQFVFAGMLRNIANCTLDSVDETAGTIPA